MARKPIVRLATPMANGVEPHPEYVKTVHELVRASEKNRLPFDLQVLQLPCSHLPTGRDKLARAILQGGQVLPDLSFSEFQIIPHFDYLLFLDADQSITPGQAVRLFEHCRAVKAPVASVTTPRGCPGYYNVGSWRKGTPGLVELARAPQRRGLRRVDWAGAGCIILPTAVLERLPFPWFLDRVVRKDGQAFTTGEDVGFCVACGENGVPVFADFGIYSKHYTGEPQPGENPANGERKATMATPKKPASKKTAPTAAVPPAPVPQQQPAAAPTAQDMPPSIHLARFARVDRQNWDSAIQWMERAEGALSAAYNRIKELEQQLAAGTAGQ